MLQVQKSLTDTVYACFVLTSRCRVLGNIWMFLFLLSSF